MSALIHLSIILSIIAASASASLGLATTQPARVPTTQAAVDFKNREIEPLQVVDGHKACVLIFIASDCPISNSYAPMIAQLCRTFTPVGIDFYTVYPSAAETCETIRAHHDQYGFPCDALLDPAHTLAHILQATVTPEVVVIGPGGMVLYRGRIDDQYVVIGRKRFAATTRELRDVLESIATGKAVQTLSMPAVGCSID